MTTRTELYQRTEQTWPADVPVPTPEAAIKGARKLWRFTRPGVPIPKTELTSGRRFTWIKRGVLKVNPNRPGSDGGGWKALVHDLSHLIERRTTGKAHSKHHARLEARMIREVIKRGWLDGALD